jgi:hypothetical protein
MTAPAASATAHYLIHSAVGLGCDHEGIEAFGVASVSPSKQSPIAE